MDHRARLGTALTLAGLLAGCKADSPPADRAVAHSDSTAARVVTVTAANFSFDAPAQIPAGAITFRLVNDGSELHQAQLIKLEDGKTLKDLGKAMTNPGPPPSWVKWVGGPNGIAPGQESKTTAVLAPGQYAYLCFIPSPDGKIHVSKGMARPFEVTAGSSASASDFPAADVTFKLVDYGFESSQPLTAGHHIIMVENAGPQAHELVLLKLAPGKTTEDFGRWAETGMKGPPPAQPLGGVAALDKGGRGTFEVNLTPGDYGLICFVPDAKDGKPHLAHSMMKNLKVS
jgi:hypothetical protein